MPTIEQATAFAQAWIEAWNRHDLDAILAHYAPTVHFTSPRIVAVTGRPDGSLRSLSELREYFARALAAQPHLRFDLLDTLAGMDGLTLYYRNHRGQTVAETVWLDAAGQVLRATVHYAESASGAR